MQLIDIGYILRTAVLKKDVLDAMETQNGVAEIVTGKLIAALSVHGIDLVSVAQGHIEGVHIERP